MCYSAESLLFMTMFMNIIVILMVWGPQVTRNPMDCSTHQEQKEIAACTESRFFPLFASNFMYSNSLLTRIAPVVLFWRPLGFHSLQALISSLHNIEHKHCALSSNRETLVIQFNCRRINFYYVL